MKPKGTLCDLGELVHRVGVGRHGAVAADPAGGIGDGDGDGFDVDIQADIFDTQVCG